MCRLATEGQSSAGVGNKASNSHIAQHGIKSEIIPHNYCLFCLSKTQRLRALRRTPNMLSSEEQRELVLAVRGKDPFDVRTGGQRGIKANQPLMNSNEH